MSASLISPPPSISSSLVEVFNEDTSKSNDIIENDVGSYAVRIGVDLRVDPHLRDLVESGLRAPLPLGWRPYKEIVKGRWFYHNSASGLSQWEHPLDADFRARATWARQEAAMNKLTQVALPQSLPPLKKLGASRPPGALGLHHGSLSAGSIMKPPPHPNRHSEDGLMLHRGQSLEKDVDPYDDVASNNSSTAGIPELPNPSARVIKKPPSSLLLTGSGANFLKSSSKVTEDDDDDDGQKSGNNAATSASVVSVPLKGILLTHNNESKSKKDSVMNVIDSDLWSLRPDFMTDKEQDMMSSLNISLKDKPGVKFSLDPEEEEDDAEFKFEPIESDATSSSSISAPKPLPPNSNPPQKMTKLLLRRNSGGGESDMEGNVEVLMKPKPPKVHNGPGGEKEEASSLLEKARAENESFLTAARADLEAQKTLEMGKMEAELQNLKSSLEKELEDRRAQLKLSHNEALSLLDQEGRQNALLKETKDSLREEQRKQVAHMKDYHASMIAKLKKDFKAEETKTLEEHKKRMAEIRAKCAREAEDLERKLKAESDARMKALMADLQKEKAAVESELKAGIEALRMDMSNLKAQVQQEKPKTPEPGSPTTLNTSALSSSPSRQKKEASKPKDNDIKALNEKYLELERKYVSLKKGIRKIAANALGSKLNPDKTNTTNPNKKKPSTAPPQPKTKDSKIRPAQKNPAVFDSDSYPQSLDQHHHHKPEDDNDEDSKLATALKSLETLKVQILELQQNRDKNKKPKVEDARLRASKSASELPEASDNDSEADREIVDEAKEFIRSQKERLNNHNTFSHHAIPAPLNYQQLLLHPYDMAETDSGLGSSPAVVKSDLRSTEKKKISADIAAICSSLSHLDAQMRMMWSVVTSPNNVPPKVNNQQRPVTSGPMLMSSTSSPSNTSVSLIHSLDKELAEFQATKERILSQFKNTNKMNNNRLSVSTYDLRSARNPNDIEEKTNALREWLEKFS